MGSGWREAPTPQDLLFVCIATGKGVVLPRGTVTNRGSQSKLGGTRVCNGTSVQHIVSAR